MGPFATRQVILLPFPFSDLSETKLRPALLLADAGKGDWLLCHQITSNPYADPRGVALADADFVDGGLQRTSHARAGKLVTAHESLFRRAVGRLGVERHMQVVEAVVEMVRQGSDAE